VALSKGMQSLGIRMARGLNRLAKRRGPVLADRYHARALKSPLEVRRALLYTLNNTKKHGAQAGVTYARYVVDGYVVDGYSSAPSFNGWSRAVVGCPAPSPDAGLATVAPHSWLLCEGWRRRRGPLDPGEVPPH
jgi:hypothetical protein